MMNFIIFPLIIISFFFQCAKAKKEDLTKKVATTPPPPPKPALNRVIKGNFSFQIKTTKLGANAIVIISKDQTQSFLVYGSAKTATQSMGSSAAVLDIFKRLTDQEKTGSFDLISEKNTICHQDDTALDAGLPLEWICLDQIDNLVEVAKPIDITCGTLVFKYSDNPNDYKDPAFSNFNIYITQSNNTNILRKTYLLEKEFPNTNMKGISDKQKNDIILAYSKNSIVNMCGQGYTVYNQENKLEYFVFLQMTTLTLNENPNGSPFNPVEMIGTLSVRVEGNIRNIYFAPEPVNGVSRPELLVLGQENNIQSALDQVRNSNLKKTFIQALAVLRKDSSGADRYYFYSFNQINSL